MNSRSHKLQFLLIAFLAGCQTTELVSRVNFPDAAATVSAAAESAAATPEMAELTQLTESLTQPRTASELVTVALDRHPQILAARERIRALQEQITVAGSQPDPRMTLTAQPAPVQTASGAQQFIVSASQEYLSEEKRTARADVARSMVQIAEATLRAKEVEISAQVRHNAYELRFLQLSIAVTQTEQQLLQEIRTIAATRYRTSATSQQDVLRADLEISRLQNELILLKQQVTTRQTRLAELLNVPLTLKIRTIESTPDPVLPDDPAMLQDLALMLRPELKASEAAIQRDRRAAELAREEYYSDVTLGLSWIDVADHGQSPVANGQDAVMLTAGFRFPIRQERIRAAVAAAEADMAASTRSHDALRNSTEADVQDLFQRAQSLQQMLHIDREEMIPRARQTLQVSSAAYNVGQVDFLQLMDNWRTLLTLQTARLRREADLWQTISALQRATGDAWSPATVADLPAAEADPQQ